MSVELSRCGFLEGLALTLLLLEQLFAKHLLHYDKE